MNENQVANVKQVGLKMSIINSCKFMKPHECSVIFDLSHKTVGPGKQLT